MKQFFDATWIGDLFGLVGIVLAVVFYRRSKTRAAMSFQTRGERLVGAAAILSTSIEVRHRGRVIPQLTKTIMVLWNSGNVTIDGSANVGADPMRICVGDDSEVLSAEVERTTRAVTQIRPSLDRAKQGQVLLDFTFLDPGDGAIITVLHTGQYRGGIVAGTIKGLPQGFEFQGVFEQRKPSRKFYGVRLPSAEWVFAGCVVVFGLFSVFAGLAGWPKANPRTDAASAAAISAALHLPKGADLTMVFMGFFLLLLASAVLWSLATKKRCPKSLAAASEAASGERPA
jgi:hypothetical protein